MILSMAILSIRILFVAIQMVINVLYLILGMVIIFLVVVMAYFWNGMSLLTIIKLKSRVKQHWLL
jgi:hypothetical protein